ncbi:kinase-like protein [Coccomyxa subellipsoidea C-169]|uniref:Kinase-like protein n=1 Tax=Coccomyxa subellipsoidea (strain C-169) TaxID=574566 RepID=I0YPV7_COCSC|nr:kinase-like protein [Coccomyxa subellipsoidea C-169]EIE20426.1 kinase-like protein [Coccomyxa subellipsoidea C-169]|eukprot:XP_005644970.1 kinase-like protein [Coccomyxa subellipsoidea C-169]
MALTPTLVEDNLRAEACERRQCALIGEHTDIQRLLLAHGANMLRWGFELVDLPPLQKPLDMRKSAQSEGSYPSTATSSEQSMGLDSPHARHAADISGQAVGLPKRASSAPLDGRTRLPGLHLGRLIGLGSFGKVYKGTWEGRTVAVKVMSHEGSTANLLNARHESLVAEHVQHENVIVTRNPPPSAASPISGPMLTPSALTSSLLASSPLTSPLLTSPFEVTLRKAASSGLDDSVEPLTQLARRMSLEADLYNRQRVDPKWRSISLGEPVPKMVCPDSLAAASAERSRMSYLTADLHSSDSIEEADVIVETLLLMEHADLGSLNKYMVSACFKDNMVALLMCALDIAAGMSYLHSINLLHGDLKTANVLLKSCPPSDGNPRGFTCKIADFGLSRLVSEGKTHVSTNSHGTIAYVAPEVLQTGSMARPADVYSFAMLLLELWEGELVYRGINTHEVLFQVFGGHKPEVPGDMPGQYRMLMEDCWATDPAARPTFPAILDRLRPMLAHAHSVAAALDADGEPRGFNPAACPNFLASLGRLRVVLFNARAAAAAPAATKAGPEMS